MIEMLWVDKYQPHFLDEIIGQKELVQAFKRYVEIGFIPNLTLGGSPGVGKTQIIKCFAHDLELIDWDEKGEMYSLQAGQFHLMNASDSRGIDMVRTTLKGLAQQPTNGMPRLIVLDEGDEITKDAQAAMRGLIQECSSNTRFILTGNYPEEFLEAINSRCPLRVVPPLTKDDAIEMIKRIQDKEKFTITDDAINLLFSSCKGDMRLLINRLQDAHIVSNGNIQKNHIPVVEVGLEEVRKIIEIALTNFEQAREIFIALYHTKKDTSQILQKLYEASYFVPLTQNPENNEIMQRKLRDRIAETDFRLQQGTNSIIQLDALLNYIRLLKFIPLKCEKEK